uniref:Putative capsid protein n=1 Tax=viral metagenome TaxID=1070528 RepID=A0A6H1ZN98_9ZZZZ
MPGATDNWKMGNILMFKLLDDVEKIGSGEYVRFVLEYAKSRGGPMSGSTVFDTAKKAFLNAARFPWAFFYSNFTYDIEDEVQINGDMAELDFVMKGLDNAQKTIRDLMGDSLWATYAASQTTYGTTTKPFWGVANLMAQSDTSPYYGLIQMADLGTFTREGSSVNIWQAYQNANALVMSFSTMQTLRRNCMVGEGPNGIPNLYVTTPTLWDKFENSLQAAQRFYNQDLAKAGFQSIMFGLADVVWDHKCDASYVNAFNRSKMGIKAHRDKYFVGPVWKEPTNQALKTTQIIFSGAFGTPERRAFGRLTNVS